MIRSWRSRFNLIMVVLAASYPMWQVPLLAIVYRFS